MGYNPQESPENTTNTMGTLLGVHPIVPWIFLWSEICALVLTREDFTTK